jgi:type II secretory pathway component GspD/PulD (secretin)
MRMAGVNTAIFGTCVRKHEGGFRLTCKVMAVGLAAALGCISTPASAFEPKWPSGPYKYIVIDQDLRDALVEFGRNVNMWVKVSDQAKGRRLRGPLPSGTAEQFLKQLCDGYGLVWYFDGSVLHITPESELKTEMVDVTPLTSHDLYEELKKVGVADARFPIRTTGDERVISVSGPPSYLWAVRQTLATMVKAATPRLAKETPSENTPVVRVFRGG